MLSLVETPKVCEVVTLKRFLKDGMLEFLDIIFHWLNSCPKKHEILCLNLSSDFFNEIFVKVISLSFFLDFLPCLEEYCEDMECYFEMTIESLDFTSKLPLKIYAKPGKIEEIEIYSSQTNVLRIMLMVSWKACYNYYYCYNH